MTPQWYFWVLLSFCFVSLFVLLATFIKYKKNRKRELDIMEEKKERAMSKKHLRKTFTLSRTPYLPVHPVDAEKALAVADAAGYLMSGSTVDETPGGTTVIWPVSIELKKLAAVTAAAGSESSESDDAAKAKSSRTPKKVHLEGKEEDRGGGGEGEDWGGDGESPGGGKGKGHGGEAGKWKSKTMPHIAT